MNRLFWLFVIIVCIFCTGCSYRMNLQKVGGNDFIVDLEPISLTSKDNLKKAINQQKSDKETPKTKIADKVTSSHVEVKTQSGQGSGIVIKRNNVTYVLTTAHGLIQHDNKLNNNAESNKTSSKKKSKSSKYIEEKIKRSNCILANDDIFDDTYIDNIVKKSNQGFYLVDIIEPLADLPNDKTIDKNGIRKFGGFDIQTKNITISKKKFTQSGYTENKAKARAIAVDTLYDIAVLRIVDSNMLDVDSVDFYSGIDRIPIGSEVLHCGNILGRLPESLTQGVVSHNSRVSGFYLQLDLYAFFGSSGGGVYSKDTGECVGMVRSIYRPNITMAMSVEFMRIWARGRGLDNLFE